MRRVRLRLLLSITLLAAGCGSARALAQGAGQDEIPLRTITVRGEGEVRVEPDQVVFSAGIVAVASDLRQARSDHDRRAAALLAALEGAGVERRDVQTGRLNIRPRYRRSPGGEQVPDGYEMSQLFTVRLRNLEDLEPIIGALVESGIDQFSGPNFESSRQKELEAEARRLGQRIGEPLQISEAGTAPPPMLAGRSMEMVAASAGPVTAPGEIVARATVQVTFRLREGAGGP
jgi:uncharacterized protein YggE